MYACSCVQKGAIAFSACSGVQGSQKAKDPTTHEPAAGTRGFSHSACPNIRDHPEDCWPGETCQAVPVCEGEERGCRSGWLLRQNGAPLDPPPTLTTQAAESGPPGLRGRWLPQPSSVNLISKFRASSPGGGAPL